MINIADIMRMWRGSLLVLLAIVSFTSCTVADNSVQEQILAGSVSALQQADIEIYESRPEFIQALRPPAYYRIPKALYDYSPDEYVYKRIQDYDPENPSTFEFGFQSSVCVRPNVRFLVEVGDYFVEDEPYADFINRMQLVLNGQILQTEVETFGGLPATFAEVAEGDSVTEWIDGADYCWRLPLDTGIHEFKFRFRQTSGNVLEYTWYIELFEG